MSLLNIENSVLEHRPVLLQEAIAGLAMCPGGIYIDATLGRGGHAWEMLQHLGTEGQLLALDRDPEAVRIVGERFGQDPRLSIKQACFSTLEKQVVAKGWSGQVNGILFDLGVSSPQLDDPMRGFSFIRSGPLDMRMDPTTGESAATWLARAPEEDIERVLREFGEERYSRRIARAIIAERQKTPITTTAELTAIVVQANPHRERNKHPATRAFQAIRIFINQELTELAVALQQSLAVLAPGGRLVVVSFHSLEDRVVKHFIRRETRGELLPRDLPVVMSNFRPRLRGLGKATQPGATEVMNNPRARSAVLRIAERLEG
ncbi:16S rRNA m(4)C1402 methyltransferase [Gammaproteobacteria bacterium]